MHLLKPEVLSPESYPDTLRWSILFQQEMQRSTLSHVVPGDLGLFGVNGTDTSGQLGFFDLGDYFQTKEPGEYKLTLWPKIYKRTGLDNDLYQRIDIPPVSVTFQWDGEPLRERNR